MTKFFRRSILGVFMLCVIFGLTACSYSSSPTSTGLIIDSTPTSVEPTVIPSANTTVPTKISTTIEPTIPTLPSDVTIYLAGDSTVKTYEESQYIAGWGQYLSLFLNSNVEVRNCAHGGRSSRSFINEGRLWNIDDSNVSFTQNNGESIEDGIKAGDYLFIQFGHNDDDTKVAYSSMYDRMVPVGEPNELGIYPTTPGELCSTSELPSEFTDNVPDATKQAALNAISAYGSQYYPYGSGTFKWYLKQYVDFARLKGAIPVLITPVARVRFDGATIVGSEGCHGKNLEYVVAVRQLAEEMDCLLIDLFADSKNILEKATSSYSNFLMAHKPNDLTGVWPADYDEVYGNISLGFESSESTHYNKYGAFLQAGKVIEAILTDNSMHNGNKEYYGFVKNVLQIPKSFINPSNLLSKKKVSRIEDLFEMVTVTDPNRRYPDPNLVLDAIDDLSNLGDMSNDNYLTYQEKCLEIRAMYDKLNVDDKEEIKTNIKVLDVYEKLIADFIEVNRPDPVKVVTLSADSVEVSAVNMVLKISDFTLIGSTSGAISRKSDASSFSFHKVNYSTTYGLYLGGVASFGSHRYITFDVEKACSITVAGRLISSTGKLVLVDSSYNDIGTFDINSKTSTGEISISTIEVDSAGNYSIGSKSNNICIYYIIIEYYD